MKKIIILVALLASTFAAEAQANEGSWFGLSGSYSDLSSGIHDSGFGFGAEGGYWYLGNVAYGAYFKANFYGTAAGQANTDLKIYDLGAFLKAGGDNGLYGKLLFGVAFGNTSGNITGYKLGDSKSFFFGLAGGFLIPINDGFRFGPEVGYRHLTGNAGGDEVNASAIAAFTF